MFSGEIWGCGIVFQKKRVIFESWRDVGFVWKECWVGALEGDESDFMFFADERGGGDGGGGEAAEHSFFV